MNCGRNGGKGKLEKKILIWDLTQHLKCVSLLKLWFRGHLSLHSRTPWLAVKSFNAVLLVVYIHFHIYTYIQP